MLKKDKLIKELLNRKPRRWLNITLKEFERDMTLLQNTVLELQETMKEKDQKYNDLMERVEVIQEVLNFKL